MKEYRVRGRKRRKVVEKEGREIGREGMRI
jgi:hypothetical protein